MNLEQVVGKNVEVVTNEKGGHQSKLPVRFDLIPAVELFEVAKVLSEGAEKYGEYNWQKIPTRDHINHALSHNYAFLAGDTSDDHITHAICRLLFAAFTSKREVPDSSFALGEGEVQRLVAYVEHLERQLEEYRSFEFSCSGHSEPTPEDTLEDGVQEDYDADYTV